MSLLQNLPILPPRDLPAVDLADPVYLYLRPAHVAQLPLGRLLAQGLRFQLDVRLGERPILVVARADVVRVLESLQWAQAA